MSKHCKIPADTITIICDDKGKVSHNIFCLLQLNSEVSEEINEVFFDDNYDTMIEERERSDKD
jgi:hypothetical protein